jgi:hypothetical protein
MSTKKSARKGGFFVLCDKPLNNDATIVSSHAGAAIPGFSERRPVSGRLTELAGI